MPANRSPVTPARLRSAIDGYAASLVPLVGQSYGSDSMQQAWREFTSGSSDKFVGEDPHAALFFSWFFHSWSPQAESGASVKDPTLYGVPPTRAFLERFSSELDPLLRQYLEACLAARFGFYEVVSCKPRHGFRARNLLSGAEHEVREDVASMSLKEGEIVFALIVSVDRLVVLESIAPVSFPMSFKKRLLHWHRHAKLTGQAATQLRQAYFHLLEAYASASLPEIHNTDGDVLEHWTLHFQVPCAQRAFESLAPLAWGTSQHELLQDAKFNADGVLCEATIPWLAPAAQQGSDLGVILLGQLRIRDHRLVVSVNSRQRARRFRSLMSSIPAAAARYRGARKQSITQANHNIPHNVAVAAGHANGLMPDEDRERQQIQFQLEQLQSHHYERWLETPLTALQGRTPLQAVQDPNGRRVVVELISQFERDTTTLPLPFRLEMFASLRRRLGIPTPGSQIGTHH